jgi:hypothetical protein
MEMMNMPLDYINALYNIAIERQKEDMKRREEAKEKGEEPGLSETEAIALEDEMEGAFT